MTKRTYDRMNFYTTGKLGESRETTPEGFLLCRNVAIARTGTQLYGSGEVPVDPGNDGIIRIERIDEEVFRAETIASFEGKPVTCEHPNDFVTPDTWKQLAVGICQNVRRGDGINTDLLIADLLITDAGAIAYVNRELPELSAGYEADYLQTEPGRGVQQNIVGNHVALVERGRAGPRCSINDKEPDMAKTWMDRIRRAFKSKDEAAFEEALKEGGSTDSEETEEEKVAREKMEAEKKETADSIAALKKTVDGLVEAVEGLVKDAEETEEEKAAREAKESKDSDEEEKEKAEVGDAMKDIAVRAEILAPGFSMPTTDSVKTMSSVATVHHKVLAEAMKTADGKKVIEPLLSGRTLGKLTADATSMLFIAASEAMKSQNNGRGIRTNSASTKDFGKQGSIASINQANADFWSRKQ